MQVMDRMLLTQGQGHKQEGGGGVGGQGWQARVDMSVHVWGEASGAHREHTTVDICTGKHTRAHLSTPAVLHMPQPVMSDPLPSSRCFGPATAPPPIKSQPSAPELYIPCGDHHTTPTRRSPRRVTQASR